MSNGDVSATLDLTATGPVSSTDIIDAIGASTSGIDAGIADVTLNQIALHVAVDKPQAAAASVTVSLFGDASLTVNSGTFDAQMLFRTETGSSSLLVAGRLTSPTLQELDPDDPVRLEPARHRARRQQPGGHAHLRRPRHADAAVLRAGALRRPGRRHHLRRPRAEAGPGHPGADRPARRPAGPARQLGDHRHRPAGRHRHAADPRRYRAVARGGAARGARVRLRPREVRAGVVPDRDRHGHEAGRGIDRRHDGLPCHPRLGRRLRRHAGRHLADVDRVLRRADAHRVGLDHRAPRPAALRRDQPDRHDQRVGQRLRSQLAADRHAAPAARPEGRRHLAGVADRRHARPVRHRRRDRVERPHARDQARDHTDPTVDQPRRIHRCER